MFLLDALMMAGLRWTLETVVTAADAELNDDTALRAQLLEAEMRRETGEITDGRFADIERDLLARIREIRERRDGPSRVFAFGKGEGASRIDVEVSVEGVADGSHRPDAVDETGEGRLEAGPASRPRAPRTGGAPRPPRASRITRTRRTTRTSRTPKS